MTLDERRHVVDLLHAGDLAALRALADTMMAKLLDERPWDPQTYGFWSGLQTAADCMLTARRKAGR